MTEHHHHHHDHSELSETELRVRALETILTEKGYVEPAALDAIIQAYETKIGPHNGARVVAKAWSDPAFKKSLLEDIYGDGEICVNSYHHQGIRKVAPGFRAAALAPDGLVEAIEWTGKDWFCVGVQWHPQNEGNISLDMQLIEAFVTACVKAAAPVKTKPLSLAKAG